MGDGEKAPLRLQFNPKVPGISTITSDAGLLESVMMPWALKIAYLQESRTGRNILHHLVPLLRLDRRLAGYDDTNDQCAFPKTQPCSDRGMAKNRKGASTSEMGRFETEFLTQEDNLKGLARINTQWVERLGPYPTPASNGYGQFRESSAHNGHFECVCYHPRCCEADDGPVPQRQRSGCCFVLTPPSPSRRYTIIWKPAIRLRSKAAAAGPFKAELGRGQAFPEAHRLLS